jgi:hypothetical protein
VSAGPHPEAVARTTDEARRGRSIAERLAMRLPGRIHRVARVVLDRPGLPGRGSLIRYAYRRTYAAYNRGDWELNTLMLDRRDYVIRFGGTSRFMPDAHDEYRGIDGYLEVVTQWASAWREPRLFYEDHVEVERGLMLSMYRFAGSARGMNLDQAGADVQRFRDGWLVSQTFYWNRDEAFESLGLRPPGTRR